MTLTVSYGCCAYFINRLLCPAIMGVLLVGSAVYMFIIAPILWGLFKGSPAGDAGVVGTSLGILLLGSVFGILLAIWTEELTRQSPLTRRSFLAVVLLAAWSGGLGTATYFCGYYGQAVLAIMLGLSGVTPIFAIFMIKLNQCCKSCSDAANDYSRTRAQAQVGPTLV